MTEPPRPVRERPAQDSGQVADEVARKAERKIRARGERRLGVWFGLGMFGIIGWAVAVPTVAGVLAGTWLDAHWPAGFSWVLTLLMAGLLVGCVNAWWWLTRAHREDR